MNTSCRLAAFAALISIAPSLLAQKDRLIERVVLDWNQSGTPTEFRLVSTSKNTVPQAADLLIIREGVREWKFVNQDDVWGESLNDLSTGVRKLNAVQSSRFLFVRVGPANHSRSFLILRGPESGCCVGSLAVWTSAEDGSPRKVFYAKEHLLSEVRFVNEDSIRLIGQPSDSEAWAVKNASSYDPYRVYLLSGDHPAVYELDESKNYTVEHYCEWHGPTYDERFAAVGRTTGAGSCRVMSRAQWLKYRQSNAALFQ